MSPLTNLLLLVSFLKVAFSCTDDCSFANKDKPVKGIGIDWGVFFSQILLKDSRVFGQGID